MYYYPFGMIMPGRNYSSDSYRYGFGGHEREREINETGDYYNMEARMFDSRLARVPSIDRDARLYAPISPYSYALNNPIKMVDPDGNTIFDSEGNEVIITFNTETGAIQEISGTSDEKLIKVIMDTYKESPEGKTAIHDLDARDIRVQILVSDKLGIYKQDGEYGLTSGVTLVNSSDENYNPNFIDENKVTYDSRIVLFNSTVVPDKDNIENLDVLDRNLHVVTDEEKKLKILGKLSKKGFDLTFEETDDAFNNHFTEDEIRIIKEISKLVKSDQSFGYVDVLIHERIHVLQLKGKRSDENREVPAYKAEVKSFEQSGR